MYSVTIHTCQSLHFLMFRWALFR